MKIKGIKRGLTIEFLENMDISDGAEVIVEFDTRQPVNEVERLRKLNELFGAWSNQPELDTAFSEIDRERHIYQGRKIDCFD